MRLIADVDPLRVTSAIGGSIRESACRVADAQNVSNFFRLLFGRAL